MSDLQSNILNQYTKAIVEIAREPFLILSADLRGGAGTFVCRQSIRGIS
jgi:hypothetical protein